MKRIKKLLITIPVLIATAVLSISPATAMAQSDDAVTAENPNYPYYGSLAIVAPRVARANQEISMTVFLRWDQTPFEGANVWAFTRDQAEVVREEIRKLAEDNTVAVEAKDYEALASIHGTFIGTTGADGKLYHTFTDNGFYVLAAVKRMYFPGFTSIHIGTKPKALALEAPEKAEVGEDVLMTVTQRDNGSPVEGAGIWAISRDNAEALQADLAVLKEDTSVAAEDKDYEAVMNVHGEFLGRTDERGNLTYAFDEEGGYLLVTVKRGYIPARSGIRIGDLAPKALTLWAPNRALVDEEVTMTVYQRNTVNPVEGAGVWAISRETMDSLKADMDALRQDTATAAEEKDYESLMNIYGEFLGRTDERGNLTHVFEEEGAYLLVTVKKGYFPGWSPIKILSMPDADGLRGDGTREFRSDNSTSLRPPIDEIDSLDDVEPLDDDTV